MVFVNAQMGKTPDDVNPGGVHNQALVAVDCEHPLRSRHVTTQQLGGVARGYATWTLEAPVFDGSRADAGLTHSYAASSVSYTLAFRRINGEPA